MAGIASPKDSSRKIKILIQAQLDSVTFQLDLLRVTHRAYRLYFSRRRPQGAPPFSPSPAPTQLTREAAWTRITKSLTAFPGRSANTTSSSAVNSAVQAFNSTSTS